MAHCCSEPLAQRGAHQCAGAESPLHCVEVGLVLSQCNWKAGVGSERLASGGWCGHERSVVLSAAFAPFACFECACAGGWCSVVSALGSF